MSRNLEPIRDNEFNRFFEQYAQDYSKKIEDAILETEIGKKVKILENLGLGISISKIVEMYTLNQGKMLESNGDILLDEYTLYKVYFVEEKRISEELQIDISKIEDFSVLNKIVNDVDYRESVSKYGVEMTIDMEQDGIDLIKQAKEIDAKKSFENLVNEFIKEDIFKIDNNFWDMVPTSQLIHNLKENPIFNYSDEKAENIVKDLEIKTIDSNLINKISTQGMRNLYRLREALNQREYNSEISTQTEIQACKDELIKLLPDFQYAEFIVDENGEIDVEKAVEFLTNWENTRNENKLTEDLIAISNSDFTRIDDNNIEIFLLFIEMANRGESLTNKELAEKIAIQMRDVAGIDLFTGNALDGEKIAELYLEKTEVRTIDEMINQKQWNSYTAAGKLDRIDGQIDNDLGIRKETRDQINFAKALETEMLEKQKEDKKNAIEMILTQEKCSPEQIIALYYEFRYEELAQNKKGFKEFGPVQLTCSMEHGIAKILEEHITGNPEIFKDYLTKRGNLSGISIESLIKKEQFSNLERVGISRTHKLIEQKVANIEKNKGKDINKSNSLLLKIERLRGKSREEISDKERNEIFEEAKKLGNNNSLSKVIMKELVWLDKDKLKEIFGEMRQNRNQRQGVSLLKQTMSNLKKRIIDLPQFMMKTNSKKAQDNTLASKINTMTKKVKEQKEKIASNLELGKVKDYESKEETSNLPTIKKLTILDKIKGLFSKDTRNETITVANNNQEQNDNEVNDQTSREDKENLTTTEKSDKTVTAKTDGLEYIKVDVIPTINQTVNKSEQNNQTEISEAEPEEIDIGEH